MLGFDGAAESLKSPVSDDGRMFIDGKDRCMKVSTNTRKNCRQSKQYLLQIHDRAVNLVSGGF